MTKMSIVTGLTTQPNVNVRINVLKNTLFENTVTRYFTHMHKLQSLYDLILVCNGNPDALYFPY